MKCLKNWLPDSD